MSYEYYLDMVEVTSSNLVSPTKILKAQFMTGLFYACGVVFPCHPRINVMQSQAKDRARLCSFFAHLVHHL